MPQPKAFVTVAAERKNELKTALAQKVAELQRPVPRQKNLTAADERRLYWQIKEGWTDQEEAQLVLSGMPENDIGFLKYPERERLAKSGGRTTLGDQVDYIERMNREGPPPPTPAEMAAGIPTRHYFPEPGEDAPAAAEPAVGATPDPGVVQSPGEAGASVSTPAAPVAVGAAGVALPGSEVGYG